MKLWDLGMLETVKFGNFEMLTLWEKDLEKAGTNNSEDPSHCFLKILSTGSISSRKHEIGNMGHIAI